MYVVYRSPALHNASSNGRPQAIAPNTAGATFAVKLSVPHLNRSSRMSASSLLLAWLAWPAFICTSLADADVVAGTTSKCLDACRTAGDGTCQDVIPSLDWELDWGKPGGWCDFGTARLIGDSPAPPSLPLKLSLDKLLLDGSCPRFTSNRLCPIAVQSFTQCAPRLLRNGSPFSWMILGWSPAFMPQPLAPDRKTTTSRGFVLRSSAPPPRNRQFNMSIVTAGDALVAEGARLFAHGQDIYWVGCGIGTLEVGVFSFILARRMCTNADSSGAVATTTANMVEQLRGPLMRDATRLCVIDIAVSAAFICFDKSLSWLHPFAEPIYQIGSGSGQMLGGYAAIIMAITPPKDSSNDRAGLLAEYRLQLGFDEKLEKLKRNVYAEFVRSQSVSEAKISQLESKLASSQKEAAWYEERLERVINRAIEVDAAPPIADESRLTPRDRYNNRIDRLDRKQKHDRKLMEELKLEKEEFKAKLEKNRAQTQS